MGLLSKVLLAPVAPVAAVVWLAERLEEQAETIFFSPEHVEAQLQAVGDAHRRGEMSDAELARAEAELLGRLLERRDG